MNADNEIPQPLISGICHQNFVSATLDIASDVGVLLDSFQYAARYARPAGQHPTVIYAPQSTGDPKAYIRRCCICIRPLCLYELCIMREEIGFKGVRIDMV